MKELMDNARLAWRLIGDRRVSILVKVGIPLLIALYFFSPIDFVPDFLLGLGQLDDLGVVLLGLGLIIRFSPREVVAEHRRTLGLSQGEPTKPLDGEYRVIPPDHRSS